ncbi:hypothetical protein QYF36_004588 [Acer negundo]|nr:hypothetical protein QYF36_004588 [Acer negundo]
MGSCYSQRDKLLQGEELKDGDELLSTFGKFKLGFFNPSENLYRTTSSSSKRYIGVWYNKPEDRTSYQSSFNEVPYRKAVWVAIIDKSGSLRIDSTYGNLKIFHSGGNHIATTSVERGHKYKCYSKPIWEFSPARITFKRIYKGDVVAKLRLSNSYTSAWNETRNQFANWTSMVSPIMAHRWRGEVKWTSGLWPNGEFKSWVVRGYNFSYNSNEQEEYFTYSVKDDVISFPTLQIDQYGSLNDDSGFSMACSEEGGDCGPYANSSAICNRGSSYFVPKFGLMSSVDGTKFRESDNMTLYDCGLKCYQNCSCVAYAATNRANDTGWANHYLGVWFNRPKDVMLMLYEEDYYEPVCVANRNSPISDHSGCLTIDSSDGNLKILHSGGSPIAISSVQ